MKVDTTERKISAGRILVLCAVIIGGCIFLGRLNTPAESTSDASTSAEAQASDTPPLTADGLKEYAAKTGASPAAPADAPEPAARAVAEEARQKAKEAAPTMDTTTDPVEYARLAVVEKTAHLTGEVNGGSLKIEYSLTPWALSQGIQRHAFERHVQWIVPHVFAKFPAINEITMSATARVVDLRGHGREAGAMMVKFTRANAATVDWDNVDPDNLLRIADTQWHDPAFN